MYFYFVWVLLGCYEENLNQKKYGMKKICNFIWLLVISDLILKIETEYFSKL